MIDIQIFEMIVYFVILYIMLMFKRVFWYFKGLIWYFCVFKCVANVQSGVMMI